MKTVVHMKVLIERDTYKSFALLARESGMKIGAYAGLLIEQEVSSQRLPHNLPPYSKPLPLGVPVVPCHVGSSPNVDGIETQGVDSRCSDKDRDDRFSSDPIPCAAGCVTPCNPSKDGPAAPSLSDKEEG